MKRRKQYFLLNKPSDLENGRSQGLTIRHGALCLEEGRDRGVYYSRVFDSREKQTVWHRLRMTENSGAGQSVELTVYAGESRLIAVEDGCMDVQALLMDESLGEEELDRYMEPFIRERFSAMEDVLLHRVTGRYLWFKLQLGRTGGKSPRIGWVKLWFPKDTWLKYLPEIYEEDQESASFLERYLGMFQSVYEDMTDRIEEIPSLLNPLTAQLDQLEWMARWLAVENREIWREDQLRFLVANGVRLYQYRGTTGFMREILRLYTGREPYIIESHQLEPFFDGGDRERQLKELYGSGTWEFTVLLSGEGLEGRSRKNQLRQLISTAKPAAMECRIVILQPYIFLGQHSYLGINTVLGRYRSLELNGLCAVPFTTIADH